MTNKMLINFLGTIVFGFWGASCVLQPSSTDRTTLSNLAKIQLGKSTKQEIVRVFGEPHAKEDIVKNGVQEVQWNYFYKEIKYPRVSFLFDSMGTLVGKSYRPLYDWDKYKTLDNAKQVEPKGRFQLRKVIPGNTHWHDAGRVLFDSDLGFFIEYDSHKNTVRSISWSLFEQ